MAISAPRRPTLDGHQRADPYPLTPLVLVPALPFEPVLPPVVAFTVASTDPVLLRSQVWEVMDHEEGGVWFHLYSALSSASSWEEVTEDHPSMSRALAPLHDYLDALDAMIMSNGAKDKDGYLLELARLSGVKARVVNLGAITGGYVSPLFGGATAFVAPSHFVASNPALSRHAAGLDVRVCHPVMDASRILVAVRSCPSTESQASAASGLGVSNLSFGGIVGGRAHTSAIFTMVSRLSTCKTPGIFVRAMSVLRRRGMSQAQGRLIGTGPLLQPMEELASHLDAGVSFSGFMAMDDVPCEVMRATALVVPSFSLETFGMVAPEAMILGIPVITFGFGGTGELVRHMENGLVVDDTTPRGLANAMELLVRDKRLRDRLGTQARLDATRAMFLSDMVQCHLEALPRGEASAGARHDAYPADTATRASPNYDRHATTREVQGAWPV